MGSAEAVVGSSVGAAAAAAVAADAVAVTAAAESEPFAAAAVESSVVGQPGPGTEACYQEHWAKGHASSGQA